MGLLSRIGKFGLDVLQEDMRKRVDEVLSAGKEWQATAEKLVEALNRLTEAVEKGEADPQSVKAVGTGLRRLCKETHGLARAFQMHREVLAELLVKFGK